MISVASGLERFVYKAYPHQAAFHASTARHRLLGGAAGPGKCINIDTPVPTPNGWKLLKEIVVDDEVFSEDGTVCKVVFVSDVMYNHECFAIKFSDGEEIVADAEHLWKTQTALDCFEIRNTAQIRQTLIDGEIRLNHSVKTCEPLVLPERDVPVPPYVLGVWLGDGSSNSGQLASADPEIIRRVIALGFSTNKLKSPFVWGTIGLSAKLRDAGVRSNKHIPSVYLRASQSQRVELLRGLMDTDGTIDRSGSCSFTNTNPKLIAGVSELLSTLGIKHRVIPSEAKLNGRVTGPVWDINFTPTFAVFHLTRKLERQKVKQRSVVKRRYIEAIEPVPSVPVRCIQVDHPSHMYLVGSGMIPTHNTYALILDHMIQSGRFSEEDAPQVHTLILRRTHPKLLDTVITRFYEKIPRELYRDFNQQSGVVTWRNGATTKFGSMQHEHDVWGYQGQWYKIGYDELTEFTYQQWQNISAWNRCPVSKHCTKDGATNPIGIGAAWVESLFVNHKPCAEMDKRQKSLYNPEDYKYFPATYLENPIYANDPNYIANLDSYQEAISNALKLGIWGVAGGYFEGAWDEAVNVYPAQSIERKPWQKLWLGGDWGWEHNSAIYWFHLDDDGITRIYRELVVNHRSPEQLGEEIVSMSLDQSGRQEKYEFFAFAHDAFAEKDGPNTFGHRIGTVLSKHGLCRPFASTKDKRGREQILYDKLRERKRTRRQFKDSEGAIQTIYEPALQIADTCTELIRTIPRAPRDIKKVEEIAEFLGDDPIAGAGYGLYAMFGAPRPKPQEQLDAEAAMEIEDPVARHFFKLKKANERSQQGVIIRPEYIQEWEQQ